MGANRSARYRLWVNGHKFCAYCGKELDIDAAANNRLTIDHKRPRVLGGTSSKNNIVTSCEPCNLKKGEQIVSVKYSTKDGRALCKDWYLIR